MWFNQVRAGNANAFPPFFCNWIFFNFAFFRIFALLRIFFNQSLLLREMRAFASACICALCFLFFAKDEYLHQKWSFLFCVVNFYIWLHCHCLQCPFLANFGRFFRCPFDLEICPLKYFCLFFLSFNRVFPLPQINRLNAIASSSVNHLLSRCLLEAWPEPNEEVEKTFRGGRPRPPSHFGGGGLDHPPTLLLPIF